MFRVWTAITRAGMPRDCHTDVVSEQGPTVDETTAEVRIVWPVDASMDAVVANQFVVADGPAIGSGDGGDGSVYMVFGHVAPPVVVDPEQMRAYVEKNGSTLEIRIAAALVMTRARAAEVHAILGRHLGIGQR